MSNRPIAEAVCLAVGNRREVAVTTTARLEVRLARRRQDVAAAQALRYRVFYKEMGAAADLRTKVLRRDIDRFDRACDHLLVIDRATRRRRIRPVFGSVVGTCRLIRRGAAERSGGFYSADEFDLTPLLNQAGECLEVGRSCVAPDYRSRAVIDRLWSGIADYIRANRISVLFGCASLRGTRPPELAQPLSYLYHHHLAPPEWRPRAVPARYVDMQVLPADAVDPRAAWAALPPLLKGYLRLGAMVGEGAVVDRQFNTTDVCVVLPTARVNERYLRHYGPMTDARKAA
jgi:L-ornithine Nalpha-acyltransferase